MTIKMIDTDYKQTSNSFRAWSFSLLKKDEMSIYRCLDYLESFLIVSGAWDVRAEN